jgi:hypothetical protein
MTVIPYPAARAKPAPPPSLLRQWTFDRAGRPTARWRPAGQPTRD